MILVSANYYFNKNIPQKFRREQIIFTKTNCMFIGHFAVAFASKKIDKSISLGTAFLAAQWLDLIWPILLLTGTETVEIIPGKEPIPLSFTHYPISHSLLAVVGWALLLGTIYFLVKRNVKSAIIIGVLVLSHWFLDLLVHVPDLPLSPYAETKFGLGLWHYKYLELAIETVMLGVAVYFYNKTTAAKNKTGKIALWSLVLFLYIAQLSNTFGAAPPSVNAIAMVGLSQWLLVAWAYWIDKYRVNTKKMPLLI